MMKTKTKTIMMIQFHLLTYLSHANHRQGLENKEDIFVPYLLINNIFSS